MNNEPPCRREDDPRWLLSALADGEADAAEVGRGVRRLGRRRRADARGAGMPTT